jgi:hypothetical protein
MESSDQMNKDIKGYSERYVRWQEIRMRQVSYINNLLIILASGSLLWQAQSILTITITFQSRPLYLVSAALFFMSIFVGCWVAWTRLGDFTLTADRLRSKMEEPYSRASIDTLELRDQMKDEANKLGEITRKLLPFQFFTFVVGFFFITLDVIWHLF